jgi:hypothetical protein
VSRILYGNVFRGGKILPVRTAFTRPAPGTPPKERNFGDPALFGTLLVV